MSILSKFFGNANTKAIKKFQSQVTLINEKEDRFKALSDDELKIFSTQLKQSDQKLDEILVDSLACIREAIRRVTNEWAYDVQLIGALALHEGSIAEMKTGEGKTLVATMCLYLNAILGNCCHLVTVNDYLARRDAQWYGRALQNLGLSVSVLQNNQTYLLSESKVSNAVGHEYLQESERIDAYTSNIIYGTNSEFGFDYLRDNMRVTNESKVQNALDFVIVDEVDSVLIDEARTPLIISGQASEDLSLYSQFTKIVRNLQINIHYDIDEASRTVFLTESGIEYIENRLNLSNLYSSESHSLLKYIEACLRAKSLYHRDKDYVVKDGQIIIVDAFTGRLQEGRRWSDGLHQAIEAKEGLAVQQESMTFATITIQNYFRMYTKLAGMTGTAVTEAEEFAKIYNLDVYVIPTNVPMQRGDLPDLVYSNENAKFNAVAEKISLCADDEIPVLVGTSSIESSEKLSKLLTSRRIKHEILNAKNHESEAGIIANAGMKGAVTIATNMAGRGTDIKLGPGVVALGGLHVLGTERHESRRIDNQLRGRSGRQGDPGYTRLYVSFDDELMRRFAPDWLSTTMEKIGMSENTPIESKMVTRSIETAQSRVESNNFEARKYILEYDDVMNIHRQKIYSERDSILSGLEMEDKFFLLSKNEFDFLLSGYQVGNSEVNNETQRNLLLIFGEQYSDEIEEILRGNEQQVVIGINELFKQKYESIFTNYAKQDIEQFIQYLMLAQIDQLWVQHLTAMDEMRRGIGLRAYGQLDPLVAFKKEALSMWEDLGNSIRTTILRAFHIQSLNFNHSKTESTVSKVLNIDTSKEDNIATQLNISDKIGRNSPCPCGSGLKYKKCHGLK
ncbi:MAG: preprotein translocase subunit SecA [Dehalococcoidia bacterium]